MDQLRQTNPRGVVSRSQTLFFLTCAEGVLKKSLVHRPFTSGARVSAKIGGC